MYIKKNFDADYISNAYEKAFNSKAKKYYNDDPLKRFSYTHFGRKTWPEVIRLYKEYRENKGN